MLSIENLHVSVDDTEILRGVSLRINLGEVHAVMGRNGSGKSTLANVIMGHPAYEITSGDIKFKGTPLEEMEVFERARAECSSHSNTLHRFQAFKLEPF